MFKVVTNTDIINRLTKLEGNFDRLRETIRDSTNSCCNCKEREIKLYTELKEFLQTGLEQIQKQLDLLNFKKYICETVQQTVGETFKNNITNQIDKIERLIESNQYASAQVNQTNSESNIVTVLNKLIQQTEMTSKKVDSIFFENELVKNQLRIQEEIRRCETTIEDLLVQINKLLIN